MYERDRIDDEHGTIDLTPMLDVVFIMLIFFVVTAVFVKTPGVEIARPEAVTTQPTSSSIYVAISEDNKIWIGGDRVDPDSVRYRIERMRADNPGSDLVIQADAAAHNRFTLTVMDAATAAGIPAVALAARRQ